MKKIQAIHLLFLLPLVPPAVPAVSGQTGPPEAAFVARKVDEYGLLGSNCDYGARLDNFAFELMNNPAAEGYVVTYGPEGAGSGTGKYLLRATVNYLVVVRGIEESRVKAVYGGRYKSLTESATELWLLPPGTQAPEPRKFKNRAESFRGKLFEYWGWDDFYDGDPNGISPGRVALAGFADALMQQPSSVAYIVASNGLDSAVGAWRRVARRDKDQLQRYGVQADRIKVIFAGYEKSDGDERERPKLQFWIMPEGAPPPAKQAKRERKPKGAIRLGVFDDFRFWYAEDERWVFEGLADLLTEDEHLRGFIVVRTPASVPAMNSAEPDEESPVNLIQLVKKWKGELKRRGVGEHRVVILTSPRDDESEWGEIETWVVPPGASPPDPYAVEEVGQEEESPRH